MRTRIKICCISSAEEARLAVAAGADALGLVGAMPSGPGVVNDETSAAIARHIPPPLAGFLLTSETRADDIARHAERVGTPVVQIVSHLDPAESARLAKIAPALQRVQVIHVEDETALGLIDLYADHVHAFLLDSGRPNLAIPELGGTGRVHDWRISAEFVRNSPHPVFLAGGLNAGNVANALAEVKPFGVDICSGVRTNGALDARKLSDFIDAVRDADVARVRSRP